MTAYNSKTLPLNQEVHRTTNSEAIEGAVASDPDFGLLIAALNVCRMLPASVDKRLARQWRDRHPAHLSDRSKAQLLLLAWKYRRQMPPSLVPAAQPPPAPPLHAKGAR